MVNIARVPQGGRNFESMGEDPILASKMAVPYIQGIQSQGVIATIKHWVCNNQEFERNEVSVNIDERTLQEIYYPAFK
jgi:beta-glucosidase